MSFAIFPMSEWERMLSRRGNCRPQSGRIHKYIARRPKEFQARFDHLQELKWCFAFLVNPCNVNVAGDGCPVRQPFVTNLSAVEMKVTEMQDLALKYFSHCQCTVEFWRHAPESKYPDLKRPVYETTHFCIQQVWVGGFWVESDSWEH